MIKHIINKALKVRKEVEYVAHQKSFKVLSTVVENSQTEKKILTSRLSVIISWCQP